MVLPICRSTKPPIKHKNQINPTHTHSQLLSPCVWRVQGAAAGHGIIERMKKNTASLNQPAGSEGMMGKQSPSPRSGWHDITNGGAERNTASVLLPSSLWQPAGWRCYKVQIKDPNLKFAQEYGVSAVGDNRALLGAGFRVTFLFYGWYIVNLQCYVKISAQEHLIFESNWCEFGSHGSFINFGLN